MPVGPAAFEVTTHEHVAVIGRREAFPEIMGLAIAMTLSGAIWGFLVLIARWL